MKLIPTFKSQKFYKIQRAICILLFFTINFTNTYAQKNQRFTVVLDAGHGGKDVGCGGKHGTHFEKDVALSIVLKTGRLLEKQQGVKVIYTRKTDVLVDLWKRGNIANEADADLFVSVHCNANGSTKPFGTETYVLSLKGNDRNFRVAKAENEVILMEDNYKERYQGFNPSNPTSIIGLSLEQEENLDQSLLLANLIQSDFETSLKRSNRGVKQGAFVVLYQSYMPSVLVETGFLSNKTEGKYLSSSVGQNQVAQSICKAILEYYKIQKINVAEDDFYEGNTISTASNSFVRSSSKNKLYRVQVAASKNRISTSSYNFKGLKKIKREGVGGLYKYFLGDYDTEQQANNALVLVKSKGYNSAFIVGINKEIKQDVFSKKSEEPTVDDVYFKVQIASSTNKVSTKPSNFKGLKGVEIVKVGKYYKYYLGRTNSYGRVLKYLETAKSKNYRSALIVAFLNNKRISLKEAFKLKQIK